MTRRPSPPLPLPEEGRRLREAASLTRTQLAARLGVPPGTVRAWETGRTKPRGRRREAYARLLTSLAAEATVAVPSGHRPGPGAPPTAPLFTAPPSAAPEADVGPDPGPGSGPGPDGPDPLSKLLAEPFTEPLPDFLRHPGTGTDAGAVLTPAQAFDALYAFCTPSLVRQAYLLTGRREVARKSVERAFEVAWERWPEVARDPDPAGWVRATAYEYALAPWRRFRPRRRRPEAPPTDPSAHALLDVLLALPPPYRRTLLLYDGVGLGLPETAAETEATTPAAAHRLLHARETVAARLPELSDPEVLRRRLAELAPAERLRAAEPPRVRWTSERRARFWTRAAIAFTAVLIGTTVLTLRSAPTRYEPPVPPAPTVGGIRP